MFASPRNIRPYIRRRRAVAMAALSGILLVTGPAMTARQRETALPAPPAGGTMGFVINEAISPVIQGPDACPDGTALKLREQFLALQPEAERARLSLKENEPEANRKWQARIFGPGGTNVCSQPDLFPDRPAMRTVQSRFAMGMDLDQGGSADTCQHENYTSPQGETGIDNQEYRTMGCTREWRGTDGIKGDMAVGMRQFHASGEWTQVLLLRGVDSLENDPSVEVIYANTPDRPPVDSMGNFLRGASFTISGEAPRNRNVLRGQIVNGVLTTQPSDIKLTQTWGQGGARDIRGVRTKYDYRQGRLRLRFQPDGSLLGMMGGYRPLHDIIQSPMLGGAGSAIVAGIDCAQVLQTLQQNADGLKDRKTGKCNGISSTLQISAVPAYVNDVPPASQRTAVR